MGSKIITTLRFFTFFLLGLAIACSKSENGVQTPQFQIAQSSMARDTNPQVPDADLAAVVAGNTDFALTVFPLLDPSASSNIVFSPYSITQAFALLAPGANGNTLTGIEQALSFTLPQDRLNAAFNKLDLLLTSEGTGAITSAGEQLPILRNANAIWGQVGLSILPSYLDTLAINYGAGMYLVDFINATEDARGTINSWVESQTNNRIQNLIPEGGVTTATRIVLTNAIWFKARWASQFSVASTATQSFFNQDGSTASVPFMYQMFTVSYAQADGCQAVDIPYAGNNFSMLVIMPDPGTFDAFLSSLTPTVLGDITNQLSAQEVALSLPKFTFTEVADLGSILQSLGMTDAFNPDTADFSGIDGKRDLFIQDVFHQAFISVDEFGTEAAAATAITISGTTEPAQPLSFTIDHPYIFVIREIKTGSILFLGKVVSL
ncbi:MAG TPA: serpin family protein [Nitrospirota bacterium]|nr:serpin family protein [Nitrospirota bacterium]